ncbi:MAG: putative phospholipase A1 [Xylophilus sp.]|nr:MAG: putative phospholipase A1 [Xylophilus sp.]
MVRSTKAAVSAAALFAALLSPSTHAQPAVQAAAAPGVAWQRCAAITSDKDARLACFDQWAGQQAWQGRDTPQATAASAAVDAGNEPPKPVDTTLPATRIIGVAESEGCHDRQYSDLSRAWELEKATDCGTFGLRSYRPITLSLVRGDVVNRQLTSDASGHDATSSTDYRHTETRIQFSVRTKLAQGLLTQGDPTRQDSLWFGYTQQSYWQVFTPQLSRPFRATDYEPEVMYVYPTEAQLPFGWRWRYSGIGLVHQSNGQSLPLSRSWNRVYLMTGAELGNKWTLQARIWKRLHESADNDDNPGISNTIGRAEVRAAWNYDRDNSLAATVRTALAGNPGRGSVRLEWMQTLGRAVNNRTSLRLHTQFFTGYGDSLIDYNRKRNVLSVGFSLVDF